MAISKRLKDFLDKNKVEYQVGNLYDIDVYVDKALTEDEEIFFQAGNHIESIKMKYKDYSSLVKPRIAEFGVHLH